MKNLSNGTSKFLTLFVVTALAALLCAPVVSATPILGNDLASFAVLGATGVTTANISNLGGNLGSSTGITGTYTFNLLTPSTGSNQDNLLITQNAQLQLDAAILAVNAFLPVATITDGNLDAFQSSQTGGVIAPGTYAVAAATTNLVNTLVLDGGGSNTAVWVFQFSDTLITGSSSNVTVQNVGDGAGVGLYWTVANAATLNGPTFEGNVLAGTAIITDGDLKIGCGRLLSATANVALNGVGSNIEIGVCSSVGFDQRGDTGGGGNGGGTTVPEPATLLLFGSGLVGLVAFGKRFRKA